MLIPYICVQLFLMKNIKCSIRTIWTPGMCKHMVSLSKQGSQKLSHLKHQDSKKIIIL